MGKVIFQGVEYPSLEEACVANNVALTSVTAQPQGVTMSEALEALAAQMNNAQNNP
jgi:hypothetical protein